MSTRRSWLGRCGLATLLAWLGGCGDGCEVAPPPGSFRVRPLPAAGERLLDPNASHRVAMELRYTGPRRALEVVQQSWDGSSITEACVCRIGFDDGIELHHVMALSFREREASDPEGGDAVVRAWIDECGSTPPPMMRMEIFPELAALLRRGAVVPAALAAGRPPLDLADSEELVLLRKSASADGAPKGAPAFAPGLPETRVVLRLTDA